MIVTVGFMLLKQLCFNVSVNIIKLKVAKSSWQGQEGVKLKFNSSPTVLDWAVVCTVQDNQLLYSQAAVSCLETVIQ